MKQEALTSLSWGSSQRGKLAFGDNIEAWQFGPVVPNAYYQFSGFGAMSITTRYKIDTEKLTDKMRTDYIIEYTRSMKPWDWIDRYQMPGGAWDLIYNKGRGEKEVIPTTLIKNEK